MSSEVPSGEAQFTPEFIQRRLTAYMAKGLRLTQYLNKDEVPSRSNYTYFSEKSTAAADIADGTQAKPERVAPGADLTVVRASDLQADSTPVEVRGFKFVIENQKLEENPGFFMRYMQRLSYGIGSEIEAYAYARVAADAAAGTATLTDGVWATSTGIGKDILRMQEAFQDDSLPDKLTGIFYDATNHRELKEYMDSVGAVDGNYDNQEEIPYKGTKHIYGGSNMVHGTSIGFDLSSPPTTVAFGKVEGAYSPDVLQGMEGFKPIINVKVTPEEGLYPKTIIEMASETAFVTELPAALLKQTGL